MRTKYILVGLVAVTAAVFAFIYAASQAYGLAALAIGLGAGWLTLEIKDEPSLATVFFLTFLTLALVGSFNQTSILTILLALSTDLAAWDLSRFRARIVGQTDKEIA